MVTYNTAAMREKRSTHWEILVIGRRAGRPGSVGGDSSVVILAISTNSRSRICFTNFVGNEAVGLNGQGEEIGRSESRGSMEALPVDTLDAVAARKFSLALLAMDGVKIGSLGDDEAADDVWFVCKKWVQWLAWPIELGVVSNYIGQRLEWHTRMRSIIYANSASSINHRSWMAPPPSWRLAAKQLAG